MPELGPSAVAEIACVHTHTPATAAASNGAASNTRRRVTIVILIGSGPAHILA